VCVRSLNKIGVLFRFKKENPAGTVDPLPDFDSVCDATDEGSTGACNGGAAAFVDQYPYLIPAEPRVVHSDDLFKYWEKVGVTSA